MVILIIEFYHLRDLVFMILFIVEFKKERKKGIKLFGTKFSYEWNYFFL